MVFHLQKVSSKNSNQIKSYGCFKTGYKWRHLLPVYLVPEGFHEITAVSRVYMAKIQKQLGQKRQSNQRRQKSSLGLIWDVGLKLVGSNLLCGRKTNLVGADQLPRVLSFQSKCGAKTDVGLKHVGSNQ